MPMQPLILIFIKLHFQLIFPQNILILRNLFCTIYLTYIDIHVMSQRGVFLALLLVLYL